MVRAEKTYILVLYIHSIYAELLEIAARIGKSQQNISKTLITSLEPLLALYWEHFEKLINRYNEE